MANTATAHESAYDEQGRRHGHHNANREQQARRLRLRAAAIQQDIDSLEPSVVERGEAYGWEDGLVLRGLAALSWMARDRDELLLQARQLDARVSA